MNILLVATNRERSPYPVAPLGVLCIAAAARNAGHAVTFLDMGIESHPEFALEAVMRGNHFDVVGFGIRNLDNCWSFAPKHYFDDTRRLAEVVRRHFDGPFVLGGTGFSVSAQGWMNRLDADCGVIGEGERAFVEILDRLEKDLPLIGIEGVILSPKRSVASQKPAPTTPVAQMSQLCAPAHDLCTYKRYVKGGGFVGIQTKRGCPFKCIYCIYPQLEGKRYRLRAPEAVVDEIVEVSNRSKVREFFFVDSVFNDPRRHALAICEELRRRNCGVRWSAFCNPTGFDSELAHAMKAAGCEAVEFGQDVASNRMLSALRKPFDQDDTQAALQAAREAGLPFAIYLLFGGPGETWADVEETQTFLSKCAPANAVFATYGIRVYEGTALADIARQEGQIRTDQDLFAPAYYLSPDLAENTAEKMDRIARRCDTWMSPADWRKRSVHWGQKITMWLNVRPQWKYIRNYGKYGR